MNAVATEITRRGNARDRVLTALVAAGDRGLTNVQLCHPDVGGNRFGARIKELRDAGIPISDPRHEQGGVYRYVYGVPSSTQASQTVEARVAAVVAAFTPPPAEDPQTRFVTQMAPVVVPSAEPTTDDLRLFPW